MNKIKNKILPVIAIYFSLFFSPLLLAFAKRFGRARWRPARHLWLILSLAGGGAGGEAAAQSVGINTTGALPADASILDIVSANKGLLIPRVSLTDVNIYAPLTGTAVTSLLVYSNTAPTGGNGVGYYYWDGAAWVQLATASSTNAWLLLGNAGTVDGTNFLGTTDNVPLNFRVNNQKAGRIENNAATANTFLGYQTGNAITTGVNNTATGYQALYSNTAAGQNIAIGNGALYTQSYNPGAAWNSNNVAVGFEALYSNQPTSTTTGFQNTAVGNYALRANTTGRDNNAIGVYTLFLNTTGSSNTANGSGALVINSTGSDNTAMGTGSLAFTTGNNNTATGSYALYQNNTGDANTANGYSSMWNKTTGSNNTAIGYRSGFGNATSAYSNNCLFGYEAGYSLTTGSNNVFIGYQAGYSETSGSDKLYIDNSNTVTPLIYGDFGTNRIGIDRVPTANTLEISGDASKAVASGWAANSDKRIKTDIHDIENALAIVMKLHPVKFKYSEEWKKRNPFIQDHDHYYYNYIAQEYKEVFPESVKSSGEFLEGDKEEILQIDTYNTQIVAIKAIQELKLENEILKSQISNLTTKMEEVFWINAKK